METRKDFKELLESFNERNVEYIIVGAFALAWHGHPRYTGDLDIFVNPASDNAARVLSALDDFGFGSLGLKQSDFEKPDQVIQLGVPPLRIDILTAISSVNWNSAWAGCVRGTYGETPVRYLGKSEFKANKKAIGRYKDLADIEALDGTD
jgi:hypothetical protein